jgi:hypothetical protein
MNGNLTEKQQMLLDKLFNTPGKPNLKRRIREEIENTYDPELNTVLGDMLDLIHEFLADLVAPPVPIVGKDASFTYIRWDGDHLYAEQKAGGTIAYVDTRAKADQLSEHLGKDIAEDLIAQLEENQQNQDPELDDEPPYAVLDFEEL